MDKLYAAVAGGFFILLITPIIRPLSNKIEVISQRIYGINPVSINVERDPSIIWAGFSNWIGASVWLPRLPDNAPDDPTDWYSWAQKLGGADAHVSVLKVTIVSRGVSTVVVNPPKVRAESLPISDPPKGLIATNPVGGAEIDPKRIHVNLPMGTAEWVNPDGDPIKALGMALSPGDVEQFHVYAVTQAGRYKWHLELPILIDGKREVIKIDDAGQEFLTYGMEGLGEYFWHDGVWKSRDAF
ncbi:hypothetical protein ACWEVM_27090 [Streptomyces bauhiniae]|uniref:hypothetical protein n=1 Tax=Streptomyces bauhiniae TaxID=2340725 RepID=UPI0036AB712A